MVRTNLFSEVRILARLVQSIWEYRPSRTVSALYTVWYRIQHFLPSSICVVIHTPNPPNNCNLESNMNHNLKLFLGQLFIRSKSQPLVGSIMEVMCYLHGLKWVNHSIIRGTRATSRRWSIDNKFLTFIWPSITAHFSFRHASDKLNLYPLDFKSTVSAHYRRFHHPRLPQRTQFTVPTLFRNKLLVIMIVNPVDLHTWFYLI